MIRLARAGLLLATALLALCSCVVHASTIDLSNSYMSLSFDPSSHDLLQITNMITSPPTFMLLGDAPSTGGPGGWWNAWITAPSFPASAPVMQISAAGATASAVELSASQGVSNATFTYEFQLGSGDSSIDLVMNLTLSLSDTSPDVMLWIVAQKGYLTPSAQVGFLNFTFDVAGINPQAAGGTGDWIVVPSGFGVAQANPLEALPKGYEMHYPNSDATFQAMMYYFNSSDETGVANGAGLSMQMRDALGSNKHLFVRTYPTSRSIGLAVTVYPINSGQDLSQQCEPGEPLIPYALSLGVFAGDWVDGIATYGSWARREAAWTQRGPIASRSDVPSWLQSINFWMNSGWQDVDIFNRTQGDPAVVLEHLRTMLPILDLPSPVGFHWYEWDTILFDTGYPDYFPPKDGFVDALSALYAQFGSRLKIAPYINGRIFDVAAKSWVADGAESFAAKIVQAGWEQSNYSLYEESYGSGATFAVMCPATHYWQSKLNSIAAGLIGMGIDGLYIDQIAAAETKPCFDASHDHTLGDGRSWITGNNAMLTAVGATIGGAAGNGSFIVTESNAEPFMAHVHVYLSLAAFWVNQAGSTKRLVPVFPHIYGGLYTAMGAEYFLSDVLPDPDVYAAKLAWQFQNGATMGWWALGGTETPPPMGLYDTFTQTNAEGALVYEAEFVWLRTLDAFRTLAKAYLLQGAHSRELAFEYAPAGSEQRFANPHRNELRTVSKPRTMHSATPTHQHKHDHDHAHAHDAEEVDASNSVDSFTYSPVSASVWASADRSTLGVLFSCSSAATAGSYSLTVTSLNVSRFGIRAGLQNAPWVLAQWDAAGNMIGLNSFSDGTSISIQTAIPCRGVLFFTLNARTEGQTATTLGEMQVEKIAEQ